MNKQKRILAINDISCFGKCSLAVALPILSVAGLETCVLPTAVLSAHTGFSGFTFRDLTDDMLPQAEHWDALGLQFDGIYSGYLGSVSQVDHVEKIIDKFPCDFVLVDPVMGDNGTLYPGFETDFVSNMRRLLKKATVIVPNVTEAAFLSGIPYENGLHTEEYIKKLIAHLLPFTNGKIVVTGIHISENELGTAVWDNGAFSMISREKYDVVYSGTGDTFASALTGALMRKHSLYEAAEIASDFVIDCIKKTLALSGDRNYGVNFELCLEDYLKKIKK